MKKINQKGKCNARKCNCLHEHNLTRKNRNDHHNTVLPCWLEKADIVFLRCHPLPSRAMTRIKTQIREGQRMFPTVRIPISQSFCLILSVDSVSNYAENGQKRAERARAACLVPSSFAWFLLRNKGLREAQSRIVCKDQNVREILAKNEFMPFPATISCRLIGEWNKIAMTLIILFSGFPGKCKNMLGYHPHVVPRSYLKSWIHYFRSVRNRDANQNGFEVHTHITSDTQKRDQHSVSELTLYTHRKSFTFFVLETLTNSLESSFLCSRYIIDMCLSNGSHLLQIQPFRAN